MTTERREPAATVGGIILAAGRGTRMGRTKQLLPLGQMPLLAHAVLAAERSSLTRIVLVLGHDAGAIAPALPCRRTEIVNNPRYAEGQSTSLHAGLRALGPDVDAALILLGDQPAVRTEVIDAIITAYRGMLAMAGTSEPPARPDDGHALQQTQDPPDDRLPNLYYPIVIPSYGGQDGHPVLIDRRLWPEVMAVQGDQGARPVIRAHPEVIWRLRVNKLTPPADVDTPEDYRRLTDTLQSGLGDT